MNQNRRVTIRDVAQAAGVSVTTVSDSLRGRGRLPDATRARVRAIAGALGYVANSGAQNLRRGRTGAIGLYFPQSSINMQYYMDLAMGAAEQALTNELALTLVPAPRDAAKVARLPIDGVIVADPALGDPVLAELSALPVPMVTCERDLTPGAEPAGVIESDHVTATRELLEHLTTNNLTTNNLTTNNLTTNNLATGNLATGNLATGNLATVRVALVAPGDESSFPRDVRRAYLAWCAERGSTPWTVEVPFASTAEDITRAVRALLSDPDPPQAIVCVPDGGAAVAMHVAAENGLRVPSDLLIASYTDAEELRRLPVPVTAVDLAPREMGRRSAALLADLLEGRVQPGVRQNLPIALQIRASTTLSSQ